MSQAADDPQPTEEQGEAQATEKIAAVPAPTETEEASAADEIAPEPLTEAPTTTEAPEASETPPAEATQPSSPEAAVVDVEDLDWEAVRGAVAEPIAGGRAQGIIQRMEERLARGPSLGLAFDDFRAGPADRVIHVNGDYELGPVWFVGDVHGDLLALEAALQRIARSADPADIRIVFLGDLFDDGAHGAEVVLRVFELVLDGPMQVTILAGNHDEALSYNGDAFQSSVLPSDFTDWLNANREDEWTVRLGKLIVEFFQRAPRAIFFPDGLLATHGGIPHTDLHSELEETGNWNDPRNLQDFVWTRAHPRARKRIPNRTSRGCEYGYQDFEAFCELATRLGRPVERMIRGHDHIEERFAVPPAYAKNPVLTINTLSHRLPREIFGEYERVPVIARHLSGELPEVYRLHVPPELINQLYPEQAEASAGGEQG